MSPLHRRDVAAAQSDFDEICFSQSDLRKVHPLLEPLRNFERSCAENARGVEQRMAAIQDDHAAVLTENAEIRRTLNKLLAKQDQLLKRVHRQDQLLRQLAQGDVSGFQSDLEGGDEEVEEEDDQGVEQEPPTDVDNSNATNSKRDPTRTELSQNSLATSPNKLPNQSSRLIDSTATQKHHMHGIGICIGARGKIEGMGKFSRL